MEMRTKSIPRPKLCCTVAAIIVACGWLVVWIAVPAKMTAVFVSAVRAVGGSAAQAALTSGHAVIFGLMNAAGLIVLGLVVVVGGRMMRASCRLVWQRKRGAVAVPTPTERDSVYVVSSF